jgi:hypothetical protein
MACRRDWLRAHRQCDFDTYGKYVVSTQSRYCVGQLFCPLQEANIIPTIEQIVKLKSEWHRNRGIDVLFRRDRNWWHIIYQWLITIVVFSKAYDPWRASFLLEEVQNSPTELPIVLGSTSGSGRSPGTGTNAFVRRRTWNSLVELWWKNHYPFVSTTLSFAI